MTDQTSLPEDLFVSINTRSVHELDMRKALEKALGQLSIYQDAKKEPDQIFNVTLRAIVLCKGVLLDASPTISGEASRLDPDILIQFGTSFALGKEVQMVLVSQIERKPLPSPLIEGYLTCYSSYGALAEHLKVRTAEWDKQSWNRAKRQVKRELQNLRHFSVFGSTSDDTREAIEEFARGTLWRPKFDRQADSRTELQSLVREIGGRAFCVFCMEQDMDEDSEYEVFVALGLAIGLGVPFLVVQRRGYHIPETLKGYRAIVEYEQYAKLKQQLASYIQVFLNPGIVQWSESTFRYLSSWGDRLISSAQTEEDLDQAERLFEALTASITASKSNPVPEPYAGLGDALLARYYSFEPRNIDLLVRAKEKYEHALSLDPALIRCKNGKVALCANMGETTLLWKLV